MAEVYSSPFPVRQLVSGDLNFDGNCRPRGSGAEDSRLVPRTRPENLRRWRKKAPGNLYRCREKVMELVA